LVIGLSNPKPNWQANSLLKKNGTKKKKKKKNQEIAVNPRERAGFGQSWAGRRQGLVNPGQGAGRVWSILGRVRTC
jgi:hypothetical protein